jgi:hypothetical protein
METEDVGAETIINIGPDRLNVTDEQVVIDAKRPFIDWDVREINQVPIYFEDNKYYLVEKRKAQPPFAVRYVMLPWPVDLSTCAKGFHSYDAEAVGARDAQYKGGQRDDLVHALLPPLYPILGFLWSGPQKRLARFGFDPHSISGVSIFTSFCFLFAQGVFAVVLINTSIRSGKVVLGGFITAMASGHALRLGPISIPVMLFDVALLIALMADVAIRYTDYLREDEWAGGFLEWLKPRSKQN